MHDSCRCVEVCLAPASVHANRSYLLMPIVACGPSRAVALLSVSWRIAQMCMNHTCLSQLDSCLYLCLYYARIHELTEPVDWHEHYIPMPVEMQIDLWQVGPKAVHTHLC